MATCRVAIAGPATMAHNWAIFHFGAGPKLAVHDGAVMSACAGPAPDQRGMLTGYIMYTIDRQCQLWSINVR